MRRALSRTVTLALIAPHLASAETMSLAGARRVFETFSLQSYDKGGEVSRYVWVNMPAFFPMAPIIRQGEVSPLPTALDPSLESVSVRAPEGTTTLGEYARSPLVDAVVVVRDGAIVFEDYSHMRPTERHLAWSVSKVFASTLISILREQGRLSLDQTIGQLVGELRRSAWAEVPLRDVLDMASGIAVPEWADGAYTDPSVPHYQFEEPFGSVPRVNPARPVEEVLAGFPRIDPPGTTYRYKSADTYVLAWVVEEVTGRPYWEALAEYIWTPIGAEADAMQWVNERGRSYAGGGLYARLRDIARFGLAFTPSGRTERLRSVVSDRYLDDLKASARPEIYRAGDGQGMIEDFPSDPPSHSIWQWDAVWPDGDLYKGGYGGQGLYISPARDLVIAWFGTQSAENYITNEMLPIARQLARSDAAGK